MSLQLGVFADVSCTIPLSQDMLILAFRQIATLLRSTSSNYSVTEVEGRDEGEVAFSVEDEIGSLSGAIKYIEIYSRSSSEGIVTIFGEDARYGQRMHEVLSDLLRLKGYYLEKL